MPDSITAKRIRDLTRARKALHRAMMACVQADNCAAALKIGRCLEQATSHEIACRYDDAYDKGYNEGRNFLRASVSG